MKRTWLLVGGGIIITLFVLVWGYLLIFGTPQSADDVFADLGFNAAERPIAPIPIEPEDTTKPTVDTTGEQLRQLTVRPVAGFVATTTASSTIVRYVERGTGHIYQIDLVSGQERRLSGTTIPRITEAVFSDEIDTVALISQTGRTQDVFVGTLVNNSEGVTVLEGNNLPPNARSIALNNRTVYYTLSDFAGTVGFALNLTNDEQVEKFSVPFSAVSTLWQLPDILVYNQPTTLLEGVLFNVENNQLQPLLPARYGQRVLASEEYLIASYVVDGAYQSAATNRTGATVTEVPILALPEKCDFSTERPAVLWCASAIDSLSGEAIEDWYKGTRIAEDFLWQISIPQETATLLADPSAISGRTIDIEGLQHQQDQLFFTNKLDNTLWLYALADT